MRYADIEPLVDTLFRTWTADGESAWAHHAWAVLEQRGLTTVGAEVDRDTVVLRLLALWALGRTFYSFRFDEGSPQDWEEELDDAVGHPQGIDRAWLCARWREHYVVEENEDDEFLVGEASAELLPVLVQDEANAVARALREGLGEATLFASWCASSADTTYPLSDDDVDEWVGDGTTGAHRAYEWIADGMRL